MKQAALSMVLALSCALSWGADLNAPYQPSRAEWLRIALAEEVRSTVGSWKLRVHVVVAVFNESEEVVVVLTESNGEAKPSERVRLDYTKTVRGVAVDVLQRYPWARGLKLEVRFV